jgi:hypothetical protein
MAAAKQRTLVSVPLSMTTAILLSTFRRQRRFVRGDAPDIGTLETGGIPSMRP